VLAARGWTVLLLNPRGSDGYGERFFTAVRGAWGTADATVATAGSPPRWPAASSAT
jgi:dipeptidyl aminopeptidase/acylaminoacyl peptidase